MVPPSIITRTPRSLWFARFVAVLGILVGGFIIARFFNLAATDLRDQTGGLLLTAGFLAGYVAVIVWMIERTLLAAVEAAHADRAVARAVAVVADMDDQADHRARRLSLEQQLDDLQAADGL